MMVDVVLPYGRKELKLQLEDKRLKGVLQSKVFQYQKDRKEEELIERALLSPIGSPPLRELVAGKDRVVLISSDHTRPVPSHLTMPYLLKEIRRGNPKAQITILIATGCHRATTKEELRERFGNRIVDRERIHIHDCNRDTMVDLGSLPSKGRLHLNSIAIEADFLLAEGFIEPHFFAGFSGGRKSVLPGIASQETVLANHCADFIAHPSSRAGILEDNPIHRDMVFAAKRAGLGFILNVVIDSDHSIIEAFAGDPFLAHEKGSEFVSNLAGVDPIFSPIVITTNGGYPLDQNIYQAVKGMSAAEATCQVGGTIICASACEEGHGGEGFFQTFAKAPSVRYIMEEILRREPKSTIMDQWESQILARILLKHRVIMVTQAPKEMVEAMKMYWAPDVETAICMAEKMVKGREITIIPDGVAVIVKRDDQGARGVG